MGIDKGLFDELEARGLVQDTTDRAELRERLSEGPISLYYGVDPTAPSLHAGNLIGLLMLRRFQEAGHRPLPLAGGATGMIGDPSGRSAERNLLDDDALAANLAGQVPLLRKFIDFDADENPAKLLDNRAWTVAMTVVDFLRDVGKHVTVNAMLGKESVKSRVSVESGQGISFTEFTYMLLQANDYCWLFENEGVELQIGGSDQWGNISLGVDLIRRRVGGKAHGLTWPLLVRKDGTKYGKTAGGETIWLSPDLMSPYKFYQAWIQVEDDELSKLLLWLTFLSIDDVHQIVADHDEAPHLRIGQTRLAAEVTTLVHGEMATELARQASEALFGGTTDGLELATYRVLAEEIPSTVFSRGRLSESANLVDLLVESDIAKSKSEANRLLSQKGISVNDLKVSNEDDIVHASLRHDRYCIVRKGKKAVYLWEFD